MRNPTISTSTNVTMATPRIIGWSTPQVTSEMRRRSWIGRLLRRPETTTYQRCLAVHIHFAGPHSALS